jgi:hypothetical protein
MHVLRERMHVLYVMYVWKNVCMCVCMYVLYELQVSSSSCGWASHKGRPAINYHWNKLKSKNYNEFEEIPSNGVIANAKDAQMKQNKMINK